MRHASSCLELLQAHSGSWVMPLICLSNSVCHAWNLSALAVLLLSDMAYHAVHAAFSAS